MLLYIFFIYPYPRILTERARVKIAPVLHDTKVLPNSILLETVNFEIPIDVGTHGLCVR